ncbi:hypothetical protein ACI65C_013701 [Semiaphis heraclei]
MDGDISTTTSKSTTTKSAIHEYVDEKCGKQLIPARSRNPWITPTIIESIKIWNRTILTKTIRLYIIHRIKYNSDCSSVGN